MGIFGRKKTDTAKPTAPAEEVKAVKPVSSKKSAVQSATQSVAVNDVVLLQALVTEKATVTGTYMFKVKKSSTKSEVLKAFKAKYGKTPRKVNVLNVMGKTKLRGRQVGKRSDWKKAIVYLNKGETVDLYQ